MLTILISMMLPEPQLHVRDISGGTATKEANMLPKRIRISKATTDLLKQVKTRTGITPNILARFALAHSVEDSSPSKLVPSDTTGSEFNLSTLFGDFELHYEALLKQRHGSIDEEACGTIIAAHIERGAQALKRVKTPSDLLLLIPSSTTT
jgi:DNA sulfur modification protein DndE